MTTQATDQKCRSTSSGMCFCCCVKAAIALINAEIDLPTLGERTRVLFGKDEKGLFCTPKDGERHPISIDNIHSVCERYYLLKLEGQVNSQNTPHHLAAGNYNNPNWGECPNYRSSPYIAALIALIDSTGLI